MDTRGIYNQGFTMIETLVAITILLVFIAGPLSYASRSLSAANYAKDQITAFYLAGEAIEYIRNMRDNNSLAGNSWLSGLSDCIGGSCTIDAPNHTVASCGGACSPLRYYSTTGFYGYSSLWAETPFTRTVSIMSVSDHEIEASSTISWSSGLLTRNFTVRERIFDWQQ